jgi:hypothetical protein
VAELSKRAGISAKDYAHQQGLLAELLAAKACADAEIQRQSLLIAALEKNKGSLESERAVLHAELNSALGRLKEKEHQLSVSGSEVSLLKNHLQAARNREENMAKQLVALDIFKLDIIARELKDVEDLSICAYKSVGQEQEALKAQLSSCKSIVRNVINKCLSETQKLHIGTTVQGHDSTLILDIIEALRDIHTGEKRKWRE